MKKLCCLLLAISLLLALCACGKKKSEPELIYVDEGTQEVEEQPVRDVAILFTAGEAQREPRFYAAVEAYRESCLYEYLHGYVGLVSLGGGLDVRDGETALYTRLDLMNYMGYEAAATAVADYGCGVDTLVTAANAALFPILCGNLVMAGTDTMPMSSWTLSNYGGVCVAYVGVVVPEQVDDALLEAEGVSYELTDCVRSLNEAAAAAKTAGADYVVALASCGVDRAETLAAACQGVDVFLDGAGCGEIRTLMDSDGCPVTYGGLDPTVDSIGKLCITADGMLSVQIVTDCAEQNAGMLAYLASLGYEVETESDPEATTENISE